MQMLHSSGWLVAVSELDAPRLLFKVPVNTNSEIYRRIQNQTSMWFRIWVWYPLWLGKRSNNVVAPIWKEVGLAHLIISLLLNRSKWNANWDVSKWGASMSFNKRVDQHRMNILWSSYWCQLPPGSQLGVNHSSVCTAINMAHELLHLVCCRSGDVPLQLCWNLDCPLCSRWVCLNHPKVYLKM